MELVITAALAGWLLIAGIVYIVMSKREEK